MRPAKSIALAVVGALVIAAIVASISFAFAEKEVFELQCNLTGKWTTADRYAFHVEIPKYLGSPRVVMVGANTFDLKVGRLDNTKINATLDQKLSSWPSDNVDLMSFNFNRLTGDASVDYLRQPTDAELKADAHPPPPGYMVILSDFSERGHCVKAKPAF